MENRRLGLLGLAAAGGLDKTRAVRCFFGPTIAYSAGDMITCNGGTGFRGFNLGPPHQYSLPSPSPVCIKVFRDNGDVKYDCLDSTYPGYDVDGGVCFESPSSSDGWSYICQCRGNICQTESFGAEFGGAMAQRRLVVALSASLSCVGLLLLAAVVAFVAWRRLRTRSVRFTTAADLRAEKEKAAALNPLANGYTPTPARRPMADKPDGNGVKAPPRAVTASKRATLIQRDSDLELAGPLIEHTRRKRRTDPITRQQSTVSGRRTRSRQPPWPDQIYDPRDEVPLESLSPSAAM